MDNKQKRQLSPEQLEKLKNAREKALAVRQEKAKKMQEIKDLEKKAKEKQLNDKIMNMRKVVGEEEEEVIVEEEQQLPPPPPSENPRFSEPFPSNKKIKPAKGGGMGKLGSPVKKKKATKDIIREVIEQPSSDESDSDDENDTSDAVKHFLRNKYKAKYKSKYESKTLNQLTKGIAHDHVKNKLNDEIIRMASLSIFGN